MQVALRLCHVHLFSPRSTLRTFPWELGNAHEARLLRVVKFSCISRSQLALQPRHRRAAMSFG